MRIYIAAPWAHKGDMPEIAAKFMGLGATITHAWWETPDGKDPDYLRECAEADVEGVKTADLVVVINSAKSEGKSFEQGIAVANEKPIIIVGKLGEHSKNVFHHLTNYRWVDTVQDALATFNTIKWLLKERN